MYDEKYYDDIVNFLERVPSLDEVDKDILENSIISLDNDNKIQGVISYEPFGYDALIRYFIYHKKTPPEDIKGLVETLIEALTKEEYQRIISVVQRRDMKDFFKSVGFIENDAKNFFLDEEELIFDDVTKIMVKKN